MTLRSADFESAASASSAIPAHSSSKYLNLKWWPETGLNRRRRPFQGRALPLSYLASVQTVRCNFLREFRHRRSRGANPETVGCNNFCQYTNSTVLAPNSGGNLEGNRRGLAAIAQGCPRWSGVFYTGKHDAPNSLLFRLLCPRTRCHPPRPGFSWGSPRRPRLPGRRA